MSDLACADHGRRLRFEHPDGSGPGGADNVLNAIDHVEVLDLERAPGAARQETLLVHCFRPVPAGLTARNVRLDGPPYAAPVTVEWAHGATALPSGLGVDAAERAYYAALPAQTLVVRVAEPGDASPYRLSLVRAPLDDEPPAGFDPRLSQAAVRFKVDCPTEFDCLPADDCPPARRPDAPLDYLAKDYESFRRLMLDRLSALSPAWSERNPADVGVTLVELIAYAADRLSYQQDAVATEAYLQTARRRVSVRRHARLLDYRLHEGCSARAWLHLRVDRDVPVARVGEDGAGVRFLTRLAPDALERAGGWTDLLRTERPTVFEPLHDAALREVHNEIALYAWGDERCCLPRGATRATLVDGEGPARRLRLRPGDTLLLEEVRGPETGLAVDADPAHRQVVRLTRVTSTVDDAAEPAVPGKRLRDPLTDQAICEVEWGPADALAFPLCVGTVVEGLPVAGVSVARGNLVLADHGLTHPPAPLDPPVAPAGDRPYLPRLPHAPVAHVVPYTAGSASDALAHDVRAADPAALIVGAGERWDPQWDLLGADPLTPAFVLEVDDDGVATARFGDGIRYGRRPPAGESYAVVARAGGGTAGMLAAETLETAVFAAGEAVAGVTGIVGVRNPLPSRGGVDPEPAGRARAHAPEAFRTQRRAVTESDWEAAAQSHPGVQRAVATRRWTGSWHTIFLTVDRFRGAAVDPAFEDELRGWLEPFRLAGYDLEIDAPRLVALDVALTVCVAAGYRRSDVRTAVLRALDAREHADGTRGFFHPDNFSFGDPVYLSRLVATAAAVPGVRWVDIDPGTPIRPKPHRFRRLHGIARDELGSGAIPMERLEVARLDNDPDAPELGHLEVLAVGGL